MVGCDGWEGAFCRSSRKCEGKEEVLVPRRRASTSVPYLTLAGFQYLGGELTVRSQDPLPSK